MKGSPICNQKSPFPSLCISPTGYQHLWRHSTSTATPFSYYDPLQRYTPTITIFLFWIQVIIPHNVTMEPMPVMTYLRDLEGRYINKPLIPEPCDVDALFRKDTIPSYIPQCVQSPGQNNQYHDGYHLLRPRLRQTTGCCYSQALRRQRIARSKYGSRESKLGVWGQEGAAEVPLRSD